MEFVSVQLTDIKNREHLSKITRFLRRYPKKCARCDDRRCQMDRSNLCTDCKQQEERDYEDDETAWAMFEYFQYCDRKDRCY